MNNELSPGDLPPELRQLEQNLSDLTPSAHLIDGHAIVFEAGRQSVLAEVSASESATENRNLLKPDRATAARARTIQFTLLGSLLGTAATVLVLFSAGLLNVSAVPAGGESGLPGDIASHLPSGADSQPESLAPSNNSLANPQRTADRRLDPGLTLPLAGRTGAGRQILSAIGFVNSTRSVVSADEGPETLPVSVPAAPATTYWQLRHQFQLNHSL